MLPANIISALQVIARSGRPQVTAATEAPNRPHKFDVGQQFQATVQSKISEGLFSVKVAGQNLQMRLPSNIRSGDMLKLEVISIQPKITFSMVASNNPLSTPEQISATAQILSNLAEKPLERLAIGQLNSKPVWSAEQQAPDVKLLADALRGVLGKSGLFYEAHQAQWLRGERSMFQLLEEPQNVLTGKAQLHSSAGQPSTAPGSEQSASKAHSSLDNESTTLTASSGQAMLDKASATQAQSSNSAIPKAADVAAVSIAKELLPLVQQQLHALENHHLVWVGQVWPGQQMQWEIQGESEHQAKQQDERQWSTEMELALPMLGDVHARLLFASSGLRLTLNAANPATIDLFNRTLPMLKKSLADAGITLAAAVVEKS